MNREHKNTQFDFLKQNHPHHNFFMSLVEGYTRCILPPKNIREKLQEDGGEKQKLLDRIIYRYAFEKKVEEDKRALENDDQEKSKSTF
jgi:splicing factor 3A subunit 1